MPAQVRPLFFGASLVALEKKTGGVRPIAVGCSLRRLVAKIAGRSDGSWRYGGASQSKATWLWCTGWCRGRSACNTEIPAEPT